jgi:hypothetical protein
MAQVIPPEITDVLNLRSYYRTNDIRANFGPDIVAAVNSIREDIPNSEDRDGWLTVGGKTNWSHGKSKDAFRGINKEGGGGGGGGGSYRPPAARPRFISSRPNEAASAVPASASASAPAPAAPPAQTYTRYVSRFKNKGQSLESTIVNTIILNKLNKFSQSNYNEIKDFLMEILASGQTDFLTDFMHLIFTKAAAEEIYCPLYAQLLKELSAEYPFLIVEMMNIYSKFLEIFDEVSEAECKDNEEFIAKNREKKYRKGYSQFVTELYKQGILDKESFMKSISKIIQKMREYSVVPEHVHLMEEYSASLLRICKAIRKGDISSNIKELIKEHISPLMESSNVKTETYPSLTKKIQFAILDSHDAC